MRRTRHSILYISRERNYRIGFLPPERYCMICGKTLDVLTHLQNVAKVYKGILRACSMAKDQEIYGQLICKAFLDYALEVHARRVSCAFS